MVTRSNKPTSPGRGRRRKEHKPSDHAGFRKVAGNPHTLTEAMMAVDKPIGDNARKGAVKKRTQLKTRLGGVTAWTKRSNTSGEFRAVKKSAAKKKAAKKFKGVRRDR